MASAALPPKMRPAFETIDLIRALAAVTVVWAHSWNAAAGLPAANLQPIWHLFYISAGFGPDAVLVFFVISGYWIASSVMGRLRRDHWQWQDYATDRLTRLWLVIIPALAIGALLDGTGIYLLSSPVYYNLPVHGGNDLRVQDNFALSHLLASLTFLQTVVLPPFGSNAPLWSLANEFWYYVWFPLIAAQIYRRRFSIVATIALVVTMIFAWKLLELFPAWLLGVAVYFISERWRPDWVRQWRSALFALTLVLFVAGLFLSHTMSIPFRLAALLVAGTFGLLVLVILWGEIGVVRILRPAANYGATASFSLYVVHYPLLIFAVAIGDLGRGHSPAILVISIALCVLLIAYGWVFSRFTEVQTGAVKSWIKSRRTSRAFT